MAIKLINTRTRPSTSLPWHDPALSDDWINANAENSDKIVTDGTIEAENIIEKDEGLTQVKTWIYEDMDSMIKCQRDIVPTDLRRKQRTYRRSNGFTGSLQIIDLDTDAEIPISVVHARETEMKSSGILEADVEYFIPL